MYHEEIEVESVGWLAENKTNKPICFDMAIHSRSALVVGMGVDLLHAILVSARKQTRSRKKSLGTNISAANHSFRSIDSSSTYSYIHISGKRHCITKV